MGHFEDLRVDAMVILKWILKRMSGSSRIHLFQDRMHWQALEDVIMNMLVPQKAGNFLTSWMTIIFYKRTFHYGVSKLYY
jgi:hypothetical protein